MTTDPLFPYPYTYPYTLTIRCGDPTNDDESETYTGLFKNLAEFDMFIYGVSIARGWHNITITEASPQLVTERLESLPYAIKG